MGKYKSKGMPVKLLERLVCILLSMMTCLSLTACASVGSNAVENIEMPRQQTTYNVEYAKNAVKRVYHDAEKTSDSSKGMSNAISFRFDLAQANTVYLQVETISSTVSVAEETASDLATDLARYAEVTDKEGNKVQASTKYGALYDAYGLVIDVRDHANTFQITGGKTFDQTTISWQ